MRRLLRNTIVLLPSKQSARKEKSAPRKEKSAPNRARFGPGEPEELQTLESVVAGMASSSQAIRRSPLVVMDLATDALEWRTQREQDIRDAYADRSRWTALDYVTDQHNHSFKSIEAWPLDAAVIYRPTDRASLLLGSLKAACSLQDIVETSSLKVTVVVNMCAQEMKIAGAPTDWAKYFQQQDVSHIQCHLEDTTLKPARRWLEQIPDLVASCLRQWKIVCSQLWEQSMLAVARDKSMHVLFHGFGGINRSAGILCAWLVVAYEHSALEAVQLLLPKKTSFASLAQSTLCLGSVMAPGRFARGMAGRLQRNAPRLIYVAGRPSRLFGMNLRHHRSNDAISGCRKKSHRDVCMCVLHPHDKRCSLGIHESLVMIVTSFALRSPLRPFRGNFSVKCEMYVLQFYSNLFSVVLAQLRLTLRCRCVDASTSTPPRLCTFTSSHAHIRRSTSPPHHTHTSAHLYHLCTSTLSLLHICLSFFLSTYLFSRLCTFTSSHAHIHRSTSPPPYSYTSISRLRIHTVIPSRPPSLSLFLYIFSTLLDNRMSRSRANRRLVMSPSETLGCHHCSDLPCFEGSAMMIASFVFVLCLAFVQKISCCFLFLIRTTTPCVMLLLCPAFALHCLVALLCQYFLLCADALHFARRAPPGWS